MKSKILFFLNVFVILLILHLFLFFVFEKDYSAYLIRIFIYTVIGSFLHSISWNYLKIKKNEKE